MGRFSVDADELGAVVARMSACEAALETLTRQVEREVDDVQGRWHGRAADAQRLAHEEWREGLRQMREALAEIRLAAATARGNYTAAVDANTAMWDQTR